MAELTVHRRQTLGEVKAGGEAGLDFLGDGVVAGEGVEKEADEAARGGVFRDERVERGGLKVEGSGLPTAVRIQGARERAGLRRGASFPVGQLACERSGWIGQHA